MDDIQLPGNGAVAGKVQWTDGTPIVDARVFAAPMRRNVAATRATVTDAAGKFRLPWIPDVSSLGLGVLVQGLPVHMETGVALGREDETLDGKMTRVIRWLMPKPTLAFAMRIDAETAIARRKEYPQSYYDVQCDRYFQMIDRYPELRGISGEETNADDVQSMIEAALDDAIPDWKTYGIRREEIPRALPGS